MYFWILFVTYITGSVFYIGVISGMAAYTAQSPDVKTQLKRAAMSWYAVGVIVGGAIGALAGLSGKDENNDVIS